MRPASFGWGAQKELQKISLKPLPLEPRAWILLDEQTAALRRLLGIRVDDFALAGNS